MVGNRDSSDLAPWVELGIDFQINSFTRGLFIALIGSIILLLQILLQSCWSNHHRPSPLGNVSTHVNTRKLGGIFQKHCSSIVCSYFVF